MAECNLSAAESKTLTSFDLRKRFTDNLKVLWKEKLFFDATLVAGIGDVPVQAHRSVLSLSSDFFLKIFSSNFSESKSNEIRLESIDGTTLESILKYIYEGEVEISGANAEKILTAADFLQIDELKTICTVYIADNINPINCVGIACFADKYSFNELYEKSTAYVFERFEAVSKGIEFFELSYAQLVRFLDVERTISETILFQRIVAWIKHDRHRREKFISSLFSLINFTLLTPKLIIDQAELFLANSELCELIHKWLKWHLSSCNILLLNKIHKTTYQCYNSESKKWSVGEWSSPPMIPIDCSAIALNEKIYFFGQNPYEEYVNLICFDLKNKTWTILQGLSNSRQNIALSKSNGKLYAFGGKEIGYSSWTRTCEAFDFLTNSWSQCALLPIVLENIQVASVNERLYAVGTAETFIYRYDPIEDIWTSIECQQFSMYHFRMTAVDGLLYFVGKVHSDDLVETVKQCDPATNSWKLIKLPEFALHPSECVNFNNKLAVYDEDIPLIAEYDDE